MRQNQPSIQSSREQFYDYGRDTPHALPRNSAGASMIYFPQIRKDRHAPHATFKTFADAAPTILTIGVLSAKRRSDVGSDHVVLVLFASISIFQTRPPIR